MFMTVLSTQFEAVIAFIHHEIMPLCPWPRLTEAIQHYESLKGHVEALGFFTFPALIYHATGGEMATAVPLCASWLFYQIASQLFDDIQDHDTGIQTWHHGWSDPERLNVGLGAIFTAKICLSKLEITSNMMAEVLNLLSQAGLLAAHAQATEEKQPSLDAYFRNVIQKAGLLFGAMAQVAARLHTSDTLIIKAMRDYGLAIGTLVQIRDDVRDISPIQITNDLNAGRQTLPVLYGLAQTSHVRYTELTALLHTSGIPSKIETIYTILQEMKAFDFCTTIAQAYQRKACVALAPLPSTSRTYLINYADALLVTGAKTD